LSSGSKQTGFSPRNNFCTLALLV